MCCTLKNKVRSSEIAFFAFRDDCKVIPIFRVVQQKDSISVLFKLAALTQILQSRGNIRAAAVKLTKGDNQPPGLLGEVMQFH